MFVGSVTLPLKNENYFKARKATQPIFFFIFESSRKIILVSVVVISFYIPLNINNMWQQ